MTDFKTNNRELIQNFFAAINAKDFEMFADFLSEDLSWWIIGDLKTSGTKDKRTILTGMKLIHRIYKGFSFVLGDLTSEGNQIAVTAESHGIHRSGKTYHNHYHFLFKLKDGRISEVKEYFDTRHAAWIEGT